VGETTYDVGSGLAVPGLEATLEYGDASSIVRDRIPGSPLINDRTKLERGRITNIDGIHADPDGRVDAQVNSDTHGETAGSMLYSGRTIGLTGVVEAGSIPAVRDQASRLTRQFGIVERDLIIHPAREVPLYVNEVTNPVMLESTDDWTNATGTTVVSDPSLPIGHLTATPAGTTVRATYVRSGFGVPWSGEDVWIGMIVGPVGGSGTASITLSLITRDSDGTLSLLSSPSTLSTSGLAVGATAMLYGRFSAADLDPTTTLLGLDVLLTGASASWDLAVWGTSIVLLDPSQPSPESVIDGRPGYEWEDVAYRSRPYGPCYCTNLVPDPTFELSEPYSGTHYSDSLTEWLGVPSSGSVPFTVPPIASSRWVGEHVPRSAYFKAVKDANTTSRDFKAMTNPLAVGPGATYRVTMRVNVISKPATGTLTAGVWWGDGTYSAQALSVGVNEVSVTGVAPIGAAGSFGAASTRVGVFCLGTTTASSVLEAYLSDPCFVEVMDDDDEPFFGIGDLHVEVATNGAGPRRRIPRPFLIRRVRKSSDGPKVPEVQQDQRYRRDFTVGLRASDPRIYVLDERRGQIRMSDSANLVSLQADSMFTQEVDNLPVPAGFTYEGQVLTDSGGSDPNYVWSRDSYGVNRDPYFQQFKLPRNGVAVRSWARGSDTTFLTPPPADIKTRMYRSLEGYTYNEPHVTVGGAPSSFGATASAPPYDLRGFNLQFRGTAGARDFYYDDLTILLKRVSSTKWLELRWNSMSFAYAQSLYPSGEPNAPHAFELWSSHNTSGTLATTKLASWDYESYNSSYGLYPFRPLFDPMWLTAWISTDVVHWQLWSKYPNFASTDGLVESQTYSIPSGLAAQVGSAVAGQAGWSTRIAVGPSGDQAWTSLSALPPFIHYFEASSAQSDPLVIPMIGSIDVEPVIELRGDVVDPIIIITSADPDGLPPRQSTARMVGVMQESNPITVTSTSVTDSLGQSREELMAPGSSIATLRPGLNYVEIKATQWGDFSAHAVVSWRDALKSG